jgi:hypothetical protein
LLAFILVRNVLAVVIASILLFVFLSWLGIHMVSARSRSKPILAGIVSLSVLLAICAAWAGWPPNSLTPHSASPQQNPRFADNATYFSANFGGNTYTITPTSRRMALLGGVHSFFGFGGENDILSAYVKDGRFVVDAVLKGDTRLIANQFQSNDTSWDRNFDDSAFEVVDEKGTPMLQIVYTTPNNVTIFGVFQGKNGVYFVGPRGVRTSFQLYSDKYLRLAGYPLKKLFKYPSRKYQGQEAE